MLNTHNTSNYNHSNAGVAELVDAADFALDNAILKEAAGAILVGSSPTPGTNSQILSWSNIK